MAKRRSCKRLIFSYSGGNSLKFRKPMSSVAERLVDPIDFWSHLDRMTLVAFDDVPASVTRQAGYLK
jgi:hypothetical protein